MQLVAERPTAEWAAREHTAILATMLQNARSAENVPAVERHSSPIGSVVEAD